MTADNVMMQQAAPNAVHAMPRTAELVLELMGSKFAADMIAKSWDLASPEMKQALADAIIGHVLERIKNSDWEIRNAIDHEFMRRAHLIVTETIASKGEGFEKELDEKIRASVGSHFEEVVKKVVANAGSGAVEVVRNVVDEALKKSFESVRKPGWR